MKTVNNPVIAIRCRGDYKERASQCKFTQIVTYDQISNITMILIKTEKMRSESKQKQVCRDVLKVYRNIGIVAAKVSYHHQGAEIYQSNPISHENTAKSNQ